MLGVAVVAACLDPDSGIQSWRGLRADLEAARERIAELEAEAVRLGVEARELVDDDFAIERAIREDLSYVRRGETLLRLRAGNLSMPRNARKSLTP